MIDRVAGAVDERAVLRSALQHFGGMRTGAPSTAQPAPAPPVHRSNDRLRAVAALEQEPIDVVALELPEQHFVTQALWYVLPDRLTGALPPDVLLGALHATEHGQIAVLPLIAMCDRWDIGGLSTNIHFQTGQPTIFIYDGHPGGVGITRRGYEEFERLVGDADRLIRECPCDDGCPSCVQSPKCGNLNEHLHKGGALELMGMMLGADAGRPRRSAG